MTEAKEAYCLMQYQCDSCGKKSLIWNSRDGVTPFACSCPCGGERKHILWKSDIQMSPDYIPPAGYCDVFVDILPDRAKVLAAKRIAQFIGTKYELPVDTKEYNEMLLRLAESYVNDCCSSETITSKEYGRRLRAERKGK